VRYGQDTVDRVRSIMGPGNPVPASGPVDRGTGAHSHEAWQEAHDKILALVQDGTTTYAPVRPPSTRRWPPVSPRVRRLAAPLAAGLSVVGLAAGLTLAGQTTVHRPATGAPADATKGMPGIYVTLSQQRHLSPHILAEVHDSLTGRVLSRVSVGLLGDGMGISADHTGRNFAIDATTAGRHPVVGLFLLHVSANGHSTKVTRLPINLTTPGSQNVVDGIALSPDGTRLAVALQIPAKGNALDPRGEILVYSLAGGPTQTWTAPGDPGLPSDPAWTGGSRKLTFVWQDHLRGSASFFTGRSQVRVLDTAAPGRRLLASHVIVAGGGQLGFIQAAAAGPGGSPIIAALFKVPSGGTTGTAHVRLVALSGTTSAVTHVFAHHANPYSGQMQEAKAVGRCQVVGTDGSGEHTLAYCPDLGRIDNGVFTLLPHSSGAFDAAW
jgi:hypothetical protein